MIVLRTMSWSAEPTGSPKGLLAQFIYCMANNRYQTNGTITVTATTVPTPISPIPPVHNERAKEVARRIGNMFPLQLSGRTGTNAPYFDLNTLLLEINTCNIMTRRSVDEVVSLIVSENAAFLEYMRKHDPRHVNCKSGFYLPYKEAKCRWFREIAARS